MKSIIYILSDFHRLEEKSNTPNFRKVLSTYETVVFKSAKGPLGFTSENKGEFFLHKYLINTVLWNIKMGVFIEFSSENEIHENMLKINGLSFFDNKELLRMDEKNLTKIKLETNKNQILKRLKKPLIEIGTSAFLDYYTNKQININSLRELYNKYKDIIVWDRGEFGLYFHILSEKRKMNNLKIESIAHSLGIEVKYVENDYDVPSW
ncbi:MAG: hypothetical protein BGN96_17385 [Bacteroidales bacterium 45-6]|nr:MAG: hypothetical protein BGN96_17385 [Bacteroidales bacterium 45-6]